MVKKMIANGSGGGGDELLVGEVVGIMIKEERVRD